MRTAVENILLGIAVISGMTACQTTTAAPAQDAVISKANPEALAEIADTVSKALGGRKTILANDVLTAKPRLIIDPKYVGDRSLQRPDHFRLKKSGSKCLLIHEQSGEIYTLKKTSCTAL